MSYYRSFLDGQYANCFSSYTHTNINFKIAPIKTDNLSKVYGMFYAAVALYKMGNVVEAKTYFEEITITAPKMHLSVIANQYLSAIENQKENLLVKQEISCKSNDELYFNPKLQKFCNKKSIILGICLGCLVLLLTAKCIEVFA